MKKCLMLLSVLAFMTTFTLTPRTFGECNNYTIRWVAAVNLTEQLTSPMLGFDGDRLYGCAGKYRFCLNRNTSQLYWSVENQYYYRFREQPVVYKDKVIYNSSIIQIVDAKYGSLIGQIDIRCTSNPIIIDNYYYILSNDGVLYKIDLDTLSVAAKWYPKITFGRLSIVDKNAYFVGYNDSVICFSLDENQEKWSTQLKKDISFNSIVVDNSIFVSSYKNIYCIDTSSGKIIWETPNLNMSVNPSYRDKKLYVGLMCLDADTGKVLWGYGHNVCESVICQNKLFAFYENNVTVHDLNTGEMVWRESHPNPAFRCPSYFVVPTVCDDKIYVPTDGFVICYGSGISKIECKSCSNSICVDGNEVFSNIPVIVDEKDGSIYVDAYNVLSELGYRLWSKDNILIYCTKNNNYTSTIYLGDKVKKDVIVYGKLLKTIVIEGQVLVNMKDVADYTGVSYVFDKSTRTLTIMNVLISS